MKKLLLSLVALVAAVVSVNAEEPTYIGVGTVGVNQDWADSEYGYTPLCDDETARRVEVYGTDSIVICDYMGEGATDDGYTYDLGVTFEDGAVSSVYYRYKGVKHESSYPGGYWYVYRKGGDTGCLWFLTADSCVSYELDEAAQTGSFVIYGGSYDSDVTGNYYYITWEAETAEDEDAPTYTATGVTGYPTYDEGGYASLVSSTKSEVKVYGTDSIWVDNWCGVEGYGICVVLDEEGHVAEAKGVRDGVSSASGSPTGYMYVYTGLDDDVDYGILIPALNGYYYITASPGTVEDQSGYIETWGYAYPADYSSYTLKYYYIGWGSNDANPTAIKTISTVADDADAPVYNLAGQRVNANAKGLLIKNGKKIFVK